MSEVYEQGGIIAALLYALIVGVVVILIVGFLFALVAGWWAVWISVGVGLAGHHHLSWWHALPWGALVAVVLGGWRSLTK